MKAISIALLILFTNTCFAVDIDIANKILANSETGPQVRELNWLNLNFMDRQRKSVKALTSTHYGKFLQGNKSDLALLQRLINEEVIASNDTQQLQALGVVMGDALVSEHKELQWVIYKDDIGSTQAVCVEETIHCLFPITMLSKRMELGVKPNALQIYSKALEEMKPYLPKLPYSVTD